MKRLLVVVAVASAVGLAFASVVVSLVAVTLPTPTLTREPDPPEFKGAPTEGGDLDAFDMGGTWAVFATGKRGPWSPWESTWHVAGRPRSRNGRQTWSGTVHGDSWTEFRARKDGRPCLMLRWDCCRAGPRWFSVNRWSAGWLDEMTGDDGRTYAAVRIRPLVDAPENAQELLGKP